MSILNKIQLESNGKVKVNFDGGDLSSDSGLLLIKVASKVIRSGGYITFKLCSSCIYKKEFYETLANIRQ